MGQQPAHTTEQKAARTEPPGSCDGMCSKGPSGGVFGLSEAAIPGSVKRFRRIFCLGQPTLGVSLGAEEVGGEGGSHPSQAIMSQFSTTFPLYDLEILSPTSQESQHTLTSESSFQFSHRNSLCFPLANGPLSTPYPPPHCTGVPTGTVGIPQGFQSIEGFRKEKSEKEQTDNS